MDTAGFITQYPVRTFHKGETIFSEGEAPETVLFVAEGFVKVTALDTSGTEHLLWIASSEDIVPSEHLFSLRNELGYFYTALTPVSAHAVDKAELLAHARTNAGLMASLAAGLSDNYDDLLLRIAAIDQSSIHGRLMTTLRYLALRFGSGKTVDLHDIGLQLTHQDIAEMIGSTRETTSLELEKLRAQGAVAYSRSSFVLYPEKLL
jgi:CRP/FNR family transcriptional regulator